MNNEANLASGGSEFSDSSSSVSIDDFPPNFPTTAVAGGLLAVVTTPATGRATSRLLQLSNEAEGVDDDDDGPTPLFDNESTTMVTIMEASDCEDFPGKFTNSELYPITSLLMNF